MDIRRAGEVLRCLSRTSLTRPSYSISHRPHSLAQQASLRRQTTTRSFTSSQSCLLSPDTPFNQTLYQQQQQSQQEQQGGGQQPQPQPARPATHRFPRQASQDQPRAGTTTASSENDDLLLDQIIGQKKSSRYPSNGLDASAFAQDGNAKKYPDSSDLWKGQPQLKYLDAVPSTRAWEAAKEYPTLNSSTGRSVAISGDTDVARGFRKLDMILAQNQVRRTKNMQKFYERPGLKRKRLHSQRWRKRFQEGFYYVTQRVRQLKNQGW